MKEVKQRIVWIDWAKAILIYLMVVGHCFPTPWQGTLIYAFHMPAFFLISGYLYRPHHWMKTVKSLLLPVAFFSCVNFIIYAFPKLVKGTFDAGHLLERLISPYWGGHIHFTEDPIILFPGVWFVFALFWGRMLMGDIKCFSFVTKYWKASLLLLVLFLIIEPFVLDHNPLRAYKWYLTVPSLPFLLLGYGMKINIRQFSIKAWMIGLASLVFAAVSLWNGRSEILSYTWGHSYIVYYLNAILGSLFLFTLCSKFRQSKVIEVFSKGTLLVLAFNFVLRAWFQLLFEKIGLGIMTSNHNVYPWFVGLLIMVACYYPIKWLLKNCPVLLGK